MQALNCRTLILTISEAWATRLSPDLKMRQRGAPGMCAPCAWNPHERAKANLKTQKHERALAPAVMSALRHANLDSDITACEGDCSVTEERVHAGAEGNHSLQANIHLVRCVHGAGGAEGGGRKLCCMCTHRWIIMMTISMTRFITKYIDILSQCKN